MCLSKNRESWLDRRRAEVGATPSGEWWVYAAIKLAKVECAYGQPTKRGNRSLMATILSAAYRNLGETELALRFVKKCSHSADRQGHIVCALILGGRVPEAEAELTKLNEPQDRAYCIGDVLLSEYRVCSLSEVILSLPQ